MEQEFVTLPSNAVEHALAALIDKCIATYAIHGTSDYMIVDDGKARAELLDALRAALDQPQNHIEQHLGMVPAGWKLVPVEPTREMIEAGKDAHYEAEKRIQEPGAWEQGGFAKRAVRAAHVFQAMLDAAPQPLAPDQPQANQPAMTPIAQRKLEDLMASGYTISGYSVYHEQKHQHGFVTSAGLVGWWKSEGMEHVQPHVEQEPVAWMVTSEMQDGTRSTYPMMGRFKDVQDCCDFGEPVPLIYQHPQHKREPLTDAQIDAIADAMPGGLEGFMKGWGWRQFARAVIEATHNIK